MTGKRVARNWLATAAMILHAAAVGAHAQQEPDVPVYVAKYVEKVPVIDGLLTTPDEWAASSGDAGSWKWFAGTPDPTNNRFAIVWNDLGIFVKHEVDYGSWADRARNEIDFGYENLNLYFDPNRDHESNANDRPTDTGVDGYQIVFNQPLGESQIGVSGATTGLFTEAHVNSLFGNQGSPFSNFENLVVKQFMSNDQKKGYTELYIPWSNFDATDPSDFPDPNADTGLYHPFSPSDGEQWFFNIGRIQSNGIIPSWAAPVGAAFLASRPHGLLQFAREVTNPYDLNADGDCDELDIDILAAAIREGKTEARFDVNVDGIVTDVDRVYYVEVIKHTYIGDSNLDGIFSTSDFVAVFQVGEYEDEQFANSGWADGDWNGDADFNTADFVAAFQSGGFELGPRAAAVANVPEPTGSSLALLGLLTAIGRFRRRRK